MPVAEMLSRMSSRELTEWLAYAQLEPFGEDRADLRAGIIAAAVLNPHRKKGAPPFKPLDFMPDYAGDRPAKREPWEDALARLQLAFPDKPKPKPKDK